MHEEGAQGATVPGIAADAGRKLRWIVSGDTHLRRYPPGTQRLTGGRADAAKDDSHRKNCGPDGLASGAEQRLKIRRHELSWKLERGEDGAATRPLLFGHLTVREHL